MQLKIQNKLINKKKSLKIIKSTIYLSFNKAIKKLKNNKYINKSKSK